MLIRAFTKSKDWAISAKCASDSVTALLPGLHFNPFLSLKLQFLFTPYACLFVPEK